VRRPGVGICGPLDPVPVEHPPDELPRMRDAAERAVALIRCSPSARGTRVAFAERGMDLAEASFRRHRSTRTTRPHPIS
jgi:hypothetical protein